MTPTPNPDPASNVGWCFPDTESGILLALARGATHLWANTILFSTHPFQSSPLLTPHAPTLRIISQAPSLTQAYDDKHLVNSYLRSISSSHDPPFTLPAGSLYPAPLDGPALAFPLVAKIIRGRGSQGVRVVHSPAELLSHIDEIGGARNAMLEEFLPGAEGTVTVLSYPEEGGKGRRYVALPMVMRTGHVEDVVPYNGIVPVSANSRAVRKEEVEAEKEVYERVARECEGVARELDARAPIRIDVRRRKDDGPWVMFDINMKPVST